MIRSQTRISGPTHVVARFTALRRLFPSTYRFAPRALVLLIIFSGCISASPATDSSTIEQRNEQIVRQMTDAVNARDLSALDELVADDLVRHSAATAGITVTSLDDFKDFLRTDFAAVPDSVITVRQMISDGNLVAVHAIYAGTQTGPMGPFPPSGRRVEGPFLAFLRIEDGKIAEMWVEWDNLSMLTQLGHLPPPAPEQ